jgi:hypothetical protein
LKSCYVDGCSVRCPQRRENTSEFLSTKDRRPYSTTTSQTITATKSRHRTL